MGKGAFYYRFVLYSPEKGEEIASTFLQSKAFIESHENKSERALCTLYGFVEYVCVCVCLIIYSILDESVKNWYNVT